MFPFLQLLVLLASLFSSGLGIYRGVELNKQVEAVNAAREEAVSAKADDNREGVYSAVGDQPTSPGIEQWAGAFIPGLLGVLGVYFTSTGNTSLASIVAAISAWTARGKADTTTTVNTTGQTKTLADTIFAELNAMTTLLTSNKPMTHTTDIGGKRITITVSIADVPVPTSVQTQGAT